MRRVEASGPAWSGILRRLTRSPHNRARPVAVALAAAGALVCGAAAPPIAGAGVQVRPGTISISETFSTRSGVPAEGFVPFLAIDRGGGHGSVVDAPFPTLQRGGGPGQVRLSLAPGLLVIHRYMRICDGNCGTLDPPTAACALRLRLHPGDRVVLRVRASFLGCAIRRDG
ncbi:MAG: hypothetical protein LC720_00760 [Actinobacteria bacterium]|nr:hypothetical protein [Actinomycetota bacterium]